MRFIAERIKADVLGLPRHEREEIARTLARSLEGEPETDSWRIDEYRSGRSAMMPGEEFSAELAEVLGAG